MVLCQRKYGFSLCHICPINTRDDLKSKNSASGQLDE